MVIGNVIVAPVLRGPERVRTFHVVFNSSSTLSSIPDEEHPTRTSTRDSHPAGTQLSGKLSHLRAAARLGMPIARGKLP